MSERRPKNTGGQKRFEARIDFICSARLFQHVPPIDQVGIARNIIPVRFKVGAAVLRGEIENQMFVITKGTCSIGSEQLTSGDCFGVHDPLNEGAQDVQLGSELDAMECLVMLRSGFLKENMSRWFGNGKNAGGVWWHKATDVAPVPRKHEYVAQEGLEKVGLMGAGGSADVELHIHTKTQDKYALKRISKGATVKNKLVSGMQECLMNEKRVMLLLDSPFLCKLFETYNSDQYLYFLIEACLGGDLYARYNLLKLHGSVAHAKFYMATAISAMEYIHSQQMLYRALKPENMLLDASGYAKLCDFDMVKILHEGKTWTTCGGSANYFSREMITQQGYTFSADWWAVAILLFELLSGTTPFEGLAPMHTYSKIVRGIEEVNNFPAACKEGGVESLIRQSLLKDPEKRLAMKKGGSQNIKTHTWYAGFDWDALNQRTMEPPLKPDIREKEPLFNFNCKETCRSDFVKYVDTGSGWDAGFETSPGDGPLQSVKQFQVSYWQVRGPNGVEAPDATPTDAEARQAKENQEEADRQMKIIQQALGVGGSNAGSASAGSADAE